LQKLGFCHTQSQPLIRQIKPQIEKIVFTERADDLFSDAKEHGNGKQHEVDESNGDFFKTVQNDLKSEETGPPIHEELAKIVTRLVRDGKLEEWLQYKINKYSQPKNCEGLSKARVNQLI